MKSKILTIFILNRSKKVNNEVELPEENDNKMKIYKNTINELIKY